MGSTRQDRIEGAVDDAKGRSKLAVGELADNEDLKAVGRQDRGKGKVKQAAADVKDKIDEVVKKVTES
jgi:uncharacterized protein YjbJ (UPF0337 family)